jgi:hypothetical protein
MTEFQFRQYCGSKKTYRLQMENDFPLHRVVWEVTACLNHVDGSPAPHALGGLTTAEDGLSATLVVGQRPGKIFIRTHISFDERSGMAAEFTVDVEARPPTPRVMPRATFTQNPQTPLSLGSVHGV